jgi:hypothetical protein
MQIKGKLIKVMNLESGLTKSGKEWKKLAFLIEQQDGNYSKKIHMLAKSDVVINILSNIIIGETIICDINIESREWNDKYFTDITAWKIKHVFDDNNNLDIGF